MTLKRHCLAVRFSHQRQRHLEDSLSHSIVDIHCQITSLNQLYCLRERNTFVNDLLGVVREMTGVEDITRHEHLVVGLHFDNNNFQ